MYMFLDLSGTQCKEMASHRRLVGDDKWGWVMVGAAFCASFTLYGNQKSLGVLLIPVSDYFESDLWIIGSIGVVYATLGNILGKYRGTGTTAEQELWIF